MSYQQNFVERLERAVEKCTEEAKGVHRAFRADYATRSKAIELMAEQFRAGDYDADLMERVGMLFDDEDMKADAFTAADIAVEKIGVETWLLKADDLLSDVIDIVRTQWVPDAAEELPW
ncbi:hypothetical protein GHV40_14390 [Devosia sp. D6-9]|nr:hypothetical protein GHV40_14390 [Devosia sp. D6-9]